MNKERISLEKIKDILLEIEKRTMSNTSFNRLAKSGMALATEALSTEVTEPRMFSLEEVRKAFIAGRSYQQAEVDEYYGGGTHSFHDFKQFIQSLSPKGVKPIEEVPRNCHIAVEWAKQTPFNCDKCGKELIGYTEINFTNSEITRVCSCGKHNTRRWWGSGSDWLKKPIEPKKVKEEVINNCDGCQSNAPLKGIYHLDKISGIPYMTCQKSRYQPKKGKEVSSKIDIVEERLNQERVGYQNLKKVFYVDYVRQFVNSYLDEEISISRLCEVLNEDAHNAYVQPTLLEPNQTEAEKEKIIDYLLNQNNGSYKDLAEDSFDEGYSLARKQVIEEIEELVKKESISATDEGGVFYENVVDSDYLITKLQELCKK